MAFTDPSHPNIADFETYVYSQGITTAELPTGSDYAVWALGYAENIAIEPPPGLPQATVSGTLTASPYVMAVYNLGMHRLLFVAQDQAGQTTFADLRKEFGLLSFQAGPIISASDQSTSESMAKPDWMDSMTLQSLTLLKTPWGRFYLEYAQMYGRTLWGIS